MAVENRGGPRPTAPQNNPANVNGLGGNGQSGNINYTGFKYGMNQAVNQQRQSAPISTPRPTSRPPRISTNQPVTGITDPTAYPDEPVTTMGSDMNGSMLPNIFPEEGQMLPGEGDTQLIRSYLPAMEFWASMPDTPQSTKDYVRYLRTRI
jgi:hypothetical protein